MSVRYCNICQKEGVRYKGLMARKMTIGPGEKHYNGAVTGLVLCYDCVLKYHGMVKEGLMPVTLYNSTELSWYQWSDEPPLISIDVQEVSA